MNRNHTLALAAALAASMTLAAGCGGKEESDGGTGGTVGDGDGDNTGGIAGDGDTGGTAGDGDGDTGGTAGDGDGDTGGTAGDGDGDGDTGGTAGDGDGDTSPGGQPGDGDGDSTGGIGGEMGGIALDSCAAICEASVTAGCTDSATECNAMCAQIEQLCPTQSAAAMNCGGNSDSLTCTQGSPVGVPEGCTAEATALLTCFLLNSQ